MADGKSYERARLMRRALTPPEATLWAQLKGARLEGLKIPRQHPVGPYVLDFHCPAARLCIEVDGLIHADPDQGRHDEERDAWLKAQGIDVLRIPAAHVRHDLEAVLTQIALVAKSRL